MGFINKYRYLQEHDINTVEWTELTPEAPLYLFVPQNTDLLAEYNSGWKITEIMPVNSTGVKTHRDHFVFDVEQTVLCKRIKEFRDLTISDQEITQKYSLADTGSWRLSKKRRSIGADNQWEEYFTKCLYRPFDILFYYSHEDLVDRSRHDVMRHIISEEVFMRQVALQKETMQLMVEIDQLIPSFPIE